MLRVGDTEVKENMSLYAVRASDSKIAIIEGSNVVYCLPIPRVTDDGDVVPRGQRQSSLGFTEFSHIMHHN